MKRQHRKNRKTSGFTLIEVMITMFLISMMCLGVFAGLQQITNTALSVAVRSEAYHRLQERSEALLGATYNDFVASDADETLTSDVKTSYFPAGSAKALSLPSDVKSGRFTMKRRVVEVASTANTRTLRVEVEWDWQSRTNRIQSVLLRKN